MPESKHLEFANDDKSAVKIGNKEYPVIFGPWEKGPDPKYPDDCHFRPFTYLGINKEYTDGGEIKVLHRTPPQFLSSNTVDWDSYQYGKLKLLLVIDGKLTIRHFNRPDQKGRAVEIPKNSFVSWINEDKDTPNSVIEATGPGYYSKLIPGNFEIVPHRAKNFKGFKIPTEYWEEIEEADKRREITTGSQ